MVHYLGIIRAAVTSYLDKAQLLDNLSFINNFNIHKQSALQNDLVLRTQFSEMVKTLDEAISNKKFRIIYIM